MFIRPDGRWRKDCTLPFGKEDPSMGGFEWVILGFWAFCLFLGVIGTVVWLWSLVDCLGRRFSDSTLKLIWVLVILFGHLLGALIYLAVGRAQGGR
jgi:hypothetical protein